MEFKIVVRSSKEEERLVAHNTQLEKATIEKAHYHGSYLMRIQGYFLNHFAPIDFAIKKKFDDAIGKINLQISFTSSSQEQKDVPS